jgi:hypothetical protein
MVSPTPALQLAEASYALDAGDELTTPDTKVQWAVGCVEMHAYKGGTI